MLAVLRRWMIVLLVLATPLQVTVAATMRLCESMPPARGAPTAAAFEHHAVHDRSRHEKPSTSNADAHADCHGALADAGTADASSASDGADGSCSACAACCTAGVATSTPRFDHLGLLPSFGGVLIEPATGWRPERLERPPRSI